MDEQIWPATPVYGRRRILVLGGGAAAAAFLAACGSDEATPAPAGDTTPTPAGGTNTTQPATDGTPAPAGDTTVASGGTAPAPAGGTNAAKFGGGGGDGTVKIGFTAPLTGPLGGFGEANDFILAGVKALAADGIMLGDKSYTVEIIQADTESSSMRRMYSAERMNARIH